jgi:hypothetical protein
MKNFHWTTFFPHLIIRLFAWLVSYNLMMQLICRNARSVLSKMSMDLMKVFAFLAHLIFFLIVQILYMFEVFFCVILIDTNLSISTIFLTDVVWYWRHWSLQGELVNHLVHINAYLTSTGCQIVILLLRSWCIHLEALGLLPSFCLSFWCF